MSFRKEKIYMNTNSKKDTTGKISFRALAFQALPEIWSYQILAGLLIMIPVSFLDNAVDAVASSPDTMFTTANLGRVISDWHFPVLLLLGALLSLIYLVTEIFGRILLNDDILSGRQEGTLKILGKASRSLGKLMSPAGILLVLYVLILVPITGVGYSISISSSFSIPNFIMDVVYGNTLFTVLYITAVILLMWVSYRFAFVFHCMLLEGLSPKDAIRRSWQMVRDNRKKFIGGVLKTLAVLVLVQTLAYIILILIPNIILTYLAFAKKGVFALQAAAEDALRMRYARTTLCVFVISAGRYLYSVVMLLCSSYLLLRLSFFYRDFTTGAAESFPRRPKRARYYSKVIFIVFILALIFLGSMAAGAVIDDLEALTGHAEIIAHRAGGDLASENSIEGLEAAIEHGCYGSETDIQRTSDGYYIINHDADFGRLTGVALKPEEMTLAEIMELRIKDTTGNGAELKVPTIEEMLTVIKGREKLFIELKGATADHRMVDDIVQIVKEYDCVGDVVLISLNYEVIDYAETNYPEFETGVLFFAGIGDVAKLNCDMLLMEEQAATFSRIQKIHDSGKKAAVWTVNDEKDMKHFLMQNTDFVITDKIEMARKMQEELRNRDEYTVIVDWLNDLLDSVF